MTLLGGFHAHGDSVFHHLAVCRPRELLLGRSRLDRTLAASATRRKSVRSGIAEGEMNCIQRVKYVALHLGAELARRHQPCRTTLRRWKSEELDTPEGIRGRGNQRAADEAS